MCPALEAVLAEAGLQVTPDEFLALVADAAKRLAPPHPDRRDARAAADPERRRPGDDLPRARTAVAHAVLRDSAVTVAEAARRLGVDTSRVRHRLGVGRLVGWKDRGSWRLPAWQFTAAGVMPGLEAVLAAVPADQPALAVAAFMTTERADLPVAGGCGSPRDWLLAGGDPRRVADLVARLGVPA
ncbi:DNA-binding protein [Saccharothrix algeriensis]|uniref:DNA-binding protein n=1 Tax=Saccharothrix algeriensis TaxID=173560 RepID=A0ABS2SDR3_9PSEU|nr:DNA-binding protein [Saccharothrix algeriensis]MBM7813764.1 hypothetical protein [Saccharothrix algeriensis]